MNSPESFGERFRVTVSPGVVRACALGGVVGPVAFVGAWIIGGLAASNYSATDDAISHLAEIGASTRGLMTAGFVVFGVSLVVYAVALRATLWGWSWAAAAGSGVATLAVAAAPLGRSDAGDAVHGLFASLGYVALVLVPLFAVRPLGRAGQLVEARISLLVGLVAAFSLLATVAGNHDGFFQRLGLTTVDIWIVVSAVEILRETPAKSGRGAHRRMHLPRAKLER